jgi:hypothetical protein
MSLEHWLFPSTTKRLAKRVDELIRRRSWIGLAAIIIAFALGFAAIFLLTVIPLRKPAPAPDDLTRQLRELDHVKESLHQLSTFIDMQTAHIREEQRIIVTLSKQRSELEPIVKSQAELVEQILQLQDKRAQRNKWKDLALGLSFGILGSFTASVAFEIARGRWTKRRLIVSD